MSAQFLNQQSSSVRTLVVLLGFLVALLVLQPILWGMVESRALALHERRTLTEQIKETETRTMNIRNKYETQSVYVEQLSSVIPNSTLQIIERLETASQGLDVQVEVSRIDDGAPIGSLIGANVGAGTANDEVGSSSIALINESKSKVFPLQVTVMVLGSPQALVEYIDAIEHVRELSMIQKFTIAPMVKRVGQEIEQNRDNFQLSMTVVFYLQGDNGTEK